MSDGGSAAGERVGGAARLALEGLFPESVRVAAEPIADHEAALFPVEAEGLASALASRRHEFATGRRLARRLLSELGYPPVAIPRNPDRTPRWPVGIVGSITHSGPLCAVAVADADAFLGIGIDLEPEATLKPGLERMICFGAELDWIAAGGEADRGRRCRIVFSAKEAVYKAFHPRNGRVWRFSDVALEVDLEGSGFLARLPPDAGPSSIAGRLALRAGWILSGVAWTPGTPAGS